MKPEDYVYGVLGVLQFKLPRGIEPNELWQLFVSQVDEALKDSGFAGVGPHAREFNLLAARDGSIPMRHINDGHGYVALLQSW